MDSNRLAELASRHHLELILQFGSSVTGRTHTRSDLDIAIHCGGRRLSFSEHATLASELQDLVPADGPKVDLAIIDHADPLFLHEITESCRLLHGSPRRLQELRIYAFKRYQDHKRYLAMERAYVRRFLATAGR